MAAPPPLALDSQPARHSPGTPGWRLPVPQGSSDWDAQSVLGKSWPGNGGHRLGSFSPISREHELDLVLAR